MNINWKVSGLKCSSRFNGPVIMCQPTWKEEIVKLGEIDLCLELFAEHTRPRGLLVSLRTGGDLLPQVLSVGGRGQ